MYVCVRRHGKYEKYLSLTEITISQELYVGL